MKKLMMYNILCVNSIVYCKKHPERVKAGQAGENGDDHHLEAGAD